MRYMHIQMHSMPRHDVSPTWPGGLRSWHVLVSDEAWAVLVSDEAYRNAATDDHQGTSQGCSMCKK